VRGWDFSRCHLGRKRGREKGGKCKTKRKKVESKRKKGEKQKIGRKRIK
jgi:hypothetical protein